MKCELHEMCKLGQGALIKQDMLPELNPYHAKGYSWLVSNYATCDYSRNQSKCSTMPSMTIVA